MRNEVRQFVGRRQKGAAAIEFALVFIIFFAVFYGLVSYSLPLLMLQSFNNATAEAARSSVKFNPAGLTTAVYSAKVVANAQTVLTTQLAWLPSAFNFNVTTDATVVLSATNLLTVTIAYPTTKLKTVVPTLTLPWVGSVPSLPTNLTAQASLQL